MLPGEVDVTVGASTENVDRVVLGSNMLQYLDLTYLDSMPR